MGDVLVVSPGIEAEQLEPFGLTKIHDLQYEVNQLLKDHSSVAVIPQGPYVVGTLESLNSRPFSPNQLGEK